MSVRERAWRTRYGSLFEARLSFPYQNVHVSLEDSSVLVDAGDYSKFTSEGDEYVEEDYVPPAGLVEQLRRCGVKPEAIRQVVFTHAHYDHFAGCTTSRSGRLVPTFPRAHYFLGRADWDWPEIKKAVTKSSSNEARTLGILEQFGVLEKISGVKELAPGIEVIPAPGESPGHQVLRIESRDQTAYAIGDLFHHSVEVENPGWMPSWCDRAPNLRSRKAISKAALREDAILIPAHMPPGRIGRERRGLTYIPL